MHQDVVFVKLFIASVTNTAMQQNNLLRVDPKDLSLPAAHDY